MSHPLTFLPALARRLSKDPARWRDRIAYDAVSRHYDRLLAEDDHEAWLLTWLPGQGTTWHDHGSSSGSFVVVQGALQEDVATESEPERWVPRRRTDLTVGELRTFGPNYVHRVVNTHLEPAVSIHVYGPRLSEMTEYAESDVGLRRGRPQLAGVDW